MFEVAVVTLIGMAACTVAALTFPTVENWPIWDVLLGNPDSLDDE